MSGPTKDKIYKNFVSESCRENHEDDCASCAVIYLSDIHDEMLEALKMISARVYYDDFGHCVTNMDIPKEIDDLIVRAEGGSDET